ncbi:MAG: 16S rRNA (cytosine(967)-C(5))-methyltransferase RsmB [Clostridiales Family XIII bacterium]|nr:16S rRNA (cytosine(967)-C(5))-methyltransferase RsmB [Clostridiales Family XIII bacterium]
MDENRKIAFLILRGVEEKQAFSDVYANSLIEKSKPDSPSFIRELSYGVLREKYYLDYLIGRYIKTPVEKLPISDRQLLRMGFYQILFMGSVPDYAAVNETVVLAAHFAKGRKGFINAVLRNYLRTTDKRPMPDRAADEIAYFSIRYSYAPWIVRALLAEYGSDRLESILTAGNEYPSVTLRVNKLRTNREKLKLHLAENGYEVEENARFENMIRLKGRSIPMGDLYRSGMYSIQSEASLAAATAVDAQPEETVVDVCAAPGGKTMAMAESMKNCGKIVAMDLYQNKLNKIETQSSRLGVSIVEVKAHNSETPDPSFIGKADRVLADVPCSGLGTVQKKPEIKYREWDERMESLPERQLKILSSSSLYVRTGGVLVYSTCTILARENQNVTNRFIESNRDFEKTEERLLLPDTDRTDGFYYCKMRRRLSAKIN